MKNLIQNNSHCLWDITYKAVCSNVNDLFCFQIFQLILNSMHKYQPRVHIIRKRDHTASVINLKSEEMKTFTFPETNFIGVTAYQNQLVSHAVNPLRAKYFENLSVSHFTCNLEIYKNLLFFCFLVRCRQTKVDSGFYSKTLFLLI